MMMNTRNNPSIIRLVLVDGDPECRQICKQALEQHSTYRFEVIEAGTGRLGLKLIRSEMPDCIVIDCRLPDFDVNDLLGELAAEMGQSCAPVIVMTSGDTPATSTLCQVGISDCLPKTASSDFIQWLPELIARNINQTRLLREKNEALDQLRKAEAKYRALVEQISAITYIASLEAPGKLLYVSPQTEQFGYAAEAWLDDPLGIGLIKWVHPDDRETVIEEFAKTYEHYVPLRCEYRVITRDGKARWVLDQARVVYDDAGRPLFLQGTLVDIDNDKRRERELENYLRQLDELRAERAAQSSKQTTLKPLVRARLDSTLCDSAEFEQCLDHLLTSVREHRSEHALCYLDLDHFRIFNDTYGRAAGDHLLQSVGQTLKRRLRRSDILGRLGGDKFGLLLENCPVERAWVVATNLREAIKNCSLSWAGKDLWIGVCIGITALTAMSGDAASVLRDADTACRIAKMKGRDRIYIFDGKGTDDLKDALIAKHPTKARTTNWPVIVDSNAVPLRKNA